MSASESANAAVIEERCDAAGLRLALNHLATSPRFLRCAGGLAFVRQLELYLAPSMIRQARRVGVGGSWLHKHDVVNTVLLGLCDQDGRVARHIATASDEPWGYLAKCSVGWVRTLWGTRGISIESELFVEPRTEPAESSLTPIQEVAELTHAILLPHTEARLNGQLLPLLLWLAANPPRRLSHEHEDRAAAALRFPYFTPEQIAAVANIAWGSRPRRPETAIMAALLINPDFQPSDSPSHARALVNYRRAMRSRSLISDYPALHVPRVA